MGLMEDVGSGAIGLDTAVFVYFIEAAPAWLPVVPGLRIVQLADYVR